MNLLVFKGTDLVSGDLRHGDGPSIKDSEFNLVAVGAFIDVNDRSHIANRKPVVGEVGGQRHAVQLFDHTGRGYAVIKRGASLPVSTSQTVRRAGFRPDGVCKGPSTR